MMSMRYFRIVLGIMLLTCGCIAVFAQGGTGKLPPIRNPVRHPKRNPPPRVNQEGGGANQAANQGPNYSASIDKVALNRGTVAGEINYRGPAAKRRRIDTAADPVCTQLNPRFEIEDPLVRRGKLVNVFVYIKDGVTADGKRIREVAFPIPEEEVVLDQIGCRLVPRVIGVLVNQTVIVKNSDPTMHNVHFVPTLNPEWIQSQPAGAAPLTHRFARPEVMVRLKNNDHPWMKAYVGVLNHPFFAVTGEDGKFEIVGVPPGQYTLAAWHEGSGSATEITVKVTVKAP